jgi:hypothetical protein
LITSRDAAGFQNILYLYKFICWFQFKQKIIKLKIIALLHSLGDYMVLTVKIFTTIYCKKYDHETINKFKYILPVQRVVAEHNATH